MQLIDLCVLDLESLDFPNRILAAAALYHTVSHDITKLTGIYTALAQDKILQTLCIHFPLFSPEQSEHEICHLKFLSSRYLLV